MTTDPSSADAASGSEFDIVATYNKILSDQPELTKTVVAMKALHALLEATPASTAHETIKILTAGQAQLASNIRYPKAPLAGSQYFLLFVRQRLKESDGDFAVVRRNLLTKGVEYIDKAVEARAAVGLMGHHYVVNAFTVLTYGASRTVLAVLEHAAAAGRNFKVIYVRDDYGKNGQQESDDYVARLRAAGIPTAAVKFSAALHAVKTLKPRVNRVFLGGEVICQNGGMVGRMGSCMIAQAAAHCNIEVFLCGEMHKFSNYHATRLSDVGWPQNIKVFTTDEPEQQQQPDQDDLLEFTPGEFISRIVTENGVYPSNHVVRIIIETFGTLQP
ncbi:translation initiation factor eIF-2B subunit alpha [Geosmithia morbida]|uniref:Translation initiation factor eIF2B subunit alpha n=1 Tax=Geosmithia morbida TaxID=1094350 RepID=A0A9P5D0Q3_9HYPO|nr:translation initiation factor eIF-2B subunit alpha [Geosmithia morbida]KAF4122988.1 translation initiation factor eIF-2B subunit alpha [Geosmithia morbida]